MSSSRVSSAGVKKALPVLSRHEGVWDGFYRYYDAEGNKIDEHRSRLFCRFPDDGPYPYHQTNHYAWADGRTEVRDFPAFFRDGRIIWDNELIVGWAAEVALDDFGRTVVLYWKRNDGSDAYLYEMIQISDCGRYRNRVWHWFKDGRLFQRTLIDEEKFSDDWRGLA
jgi:hypothetical protein